MEGMRNIRGPGGVLSDYAPAQKKPGYWTTHIKKTKANTQKPFKKKGVPKRLEGNPRDIGRRQYSFVSQLHRGF